jgi:hypothetical protein
MHQPLRFICCVDVQIRCETYVVKLVYFNERDMVSNSTALRRVFRMLQHIILLNTKSIRHANASSNTSCKQSHQYLYNIVNFYLYVQVFFLKTLDTFQSRIKT